MTLPDWKDVLPTPPLDGRLRELWMTSFERPDTGLLVEHMLPSLLGGSQSISDRNLFFGELGTSLEALHGRLTVISSPTLSEPNTSQYPWLWRHVDHFMVGAKSRDVQHAKLWAFHWQSGDHEILELHVSSTNLTSSAFKAQIQAGWQVSLRLGRTARVETRNSWGELIPFLDRLGASAGELARERLKRLVTLLSHVECPPNVTFVASIPRRKKAARQLARFSPTELHILTPTIGQWTDRRVSEWLSDVGIAPNRVHLKWIADTHPWAVGKGWSLAPGAATALDQNGVRLHQITTGMRFTNRHREGDTRWSHAKLYLMRSKNRKQRRLLVTSANWSPSAWGCGRRGPCNFELGVIIDTDWTDLERMCEPFTKDAVPFYSEIRELVSQQMLQWAQATWDGKRIQLDARSANDAIPISAVIVFSDKTEKGKRLRKGSARLAWTNVKVPPFTVRFCQGAETLEVGILDLRPQAEIHHTPLAEVDPTLDTTLRDAFLLQRYGGPAVDAETISKISSARRRRLTDAVPADYSVQAWADARAAFDVVDKWRSALEEARNDPLALERIRRDGEQLLAIFKQREGPSFRIVADEMKWRIEEEP